MLENLRFHPEEEANDPQFASELASLADVYVNDAFGTAHRAHASTMGVTQYLPAVSGFLMARELEMLGLAFNSPERPFVAILGGAKVSDKIGVMGNLSKSVDTLLIGGGMAATFLRAQGLEIGDSLVEEDHVQFARNFIHKADESDFRLALPEDVVIGDAFSADANQRVVPSDAIPNGWMVMDIGPATVRTFVSAISKARTVIWNGPMGVFEWDQFAQGTKGVARALADLKDSTTVVGGGSSAEAVGRLGLDDYITHVSTGGGASLEFLEGKELPGVAALLDEIAQ